MSALQQWLGVDLAPRTEREKRDFCINYLEGLAQRAFDDDRDFSECDSIDHVIEMLRTGSILPNTE